MASGQQSSSHSLLPPVLVDDDAGMDALLEQASRSPVVAIDTESNSLHAYFYRICLIQISLPGADFLVDPLACDATPLAPIFANPSQQKVFHAAENDIVGLERDFGFTFANLFDTMLAARILGWKHAGLAKILAQEFAVHSDKRLQRTDWGRRPLQAAQMAYAQIDSHYLLPLREQQIQELHATGRWQEAQENFALLAELRWSDRPFDEEGFWKLNGARDLALADLAVLRELYLFREQEAQRLDRPPFKVLNNHVLIALTQAKPAGRQELRQVPGMTAGQVERYGRGILAAVARGRKAPPPKKPSRPRNSNGQFDPAVINRYQALREWRTRRAERRGVDPDIVLANDALLAIARVAPGTREALAATQVMGPWKLSEYGDAILKVIAGVEGENQP